MLTRDEQLARLRLIRCETVGPITFRQLLARFGSAQAALDALPDLARRGGASAISMPAKAAIARELVALEARGASLLFAGVGLYPRLLGAVEDAPPVLLAQGRLALLDRPTVAIVGARNASAIGLRFAEMLGRDLTDAGYAVVSGLARGIDSAAHRGAASATIAVVAGGLDIYYPPENEALQRRIASEGLLISEQPLATEPQARHFPRRNRIVSGLALGVVVVEAAMKSGSLITARLAGEQGREVMAVPGSPLDPRAQGCNGLIRQGATLVQSAADVIDLLQPLSGRTLGDGVRRFHPAPEEVAMVDITASERERIVALLSPTPGPVDDLVRYSGSSPPVVATVLLELELAGRLTRHAGNRVALASCADQAPGLRNARGFE